MGPNDNSLDSRQSKGIEIEFWLFENAAQDARYVIIDDEYVILDSQLPHFILTNPFDGITDLLADRAIALLNSWKQKFFQKETIICHRLAEAIYSFAS